MKILGTNNKDHKIILKNGVKSTFNFLKLNILDCFKLHIISISDRVDCHGN